MGAKGSSKMWHSWPLSAYAGGVHTHTHTHIYIPLWVARCLSNPLAFLYCLSLTPMVVYSFLFWKAQRDPSGEAIGSTPSQAQWQDFHLHTSGFEPKTFLRCQNSQKSYTLLGYTTEPSPLKPPILLLKFINLVSSVSQIN